MRSRVRDLRESHVPPMSQERLAADSGLSIRTIQGIEGGAMPRVNTALRIAEVLGVGLDDLFVEEVPA